MPPNTAMQTKLAGQLRGCRPGSSLPGGASHSSNGIANAGSRSAIKATATSYFAGQSLASPLTAAPENQG